MTMLSVLLEDFDGANGASVVGGANAADARIETARAEGYAEGLAAGRAESDDQAARSDTVITQTAAALDAELQRLPAILNAQLCESLCAVVEAVFPGIAARLIGEETVAALSGAVDIARTGPVTIKASPESAERLKEAIEGSAAGDMIKVECDESMNDLAVAASWENAGLDIDLEGVIARCRSALEMAANQLKSES